MTLHCKSNLSFRLDMLQSLSALCDEDSLTNRGKVDCEANHTVILCTRKLRNK